MRKLYTPLFIAILLPLFGWSQAGNWAVSPYVSHHLLFGDMDFEHPSKTLSPGVGVQLQYGLIDNLNIYGDLHYGSANGGSSFRYYESQFLLSILGLQYDVWRAAFPDSKFGFSVDGSIGWNMAQSYGYDGVTNQLVARVPAEGAYTNAAIYGLGFVAAIPVNDQVDITIGYRNYWIHDNDWIDAFESGDHNDNLGQASIGVRFALNGRTPMVKMAPEQVDALEARAKSAEQQRDEAQEELSTTRARYDAQIEDMYNVLSVMRNSLDSLNEKVTVLRPSGANENEYTTTNAGDSEGSSTPDASNAKWRIVIGSFPSAQRAREFVNERIVEGGNYEVVYITDLNTYRVVYDSYDTLESARKDISRVRQSVANAWIIKF